MEPKEKKESPYSIRTTLQPVQEIELPEEQQYRAQLKSLLGREPCKVRLLNWFLYVEFDRKRVCKILENQLGTTGLYCELTEKKRYKPAKRRGSSKKREIKTWQIKVGVDDMDYFLEYIENCNGAIL